ncbi:MAG TPA: DUF177 domain-containing protein [Candidatus Omnitrophota bacterium]|nr:DUF177 domain-containing protein [Candidatus Omnitrophota bacterium]HSA31433.1 DUF177 domain-containing protein [Candidatus Omnitrophota bacterium]
MRIPLRNISDRGLQYSRVLTAGELDLPQDALKARGPLKVEAVFSRAGDEVLAAFEVKATYALTCSRCLEEFERQKTDRFELAFDIDSSTEYVEFKDDLREELIIANSVFELCRNDCKGLCLQCGQNLNQKQCNCNLGHTTQDT